ncbi:MAG: outer membrane beta-barrel protein [Gemmatimonadaceae bacterium]|nr:outer membrane beta-barrel protein [Gemmatimonadaceae bacterium]
MVNTFRRARAVAALAMVVPSMAAAQLSTTRGLSLGIHLQGTSLKIEDENETNSGGGLGIRVGYGFNRIVTGFIHLDGAQIDVPSAGTVQGQWNLAHAELGARFHFANSNRRLVPYLEGSAGARVVTVSDATVPGSSDAEDISFNGGAVTFGAGLSTFFKKRAAFDVSLKWTGGTFSEVDLGSVAVRNLDIDASSFRFGIGLIFWP